MPQEVNLRIAVDAYERPAYHSRRIWYGFGPWDYAREPYEDWCVKNRAVSGIALRTGHAYDGIVRASRTEFDAHPEYWPLLGGERKAVNNPKPCLGNPSVRAIFVRHALAQFEKDPSLDSVSMDPSDGGGWCECRQCAALGTVSDRAITLANQVAAAVNAKFPGKLVGIYGYNYHSPPPNVRVHPKVVVSVATAFIKGGQSLGEIISGWSAKGATLGIREYYSVNTWDRDQPGHARGGNLDYLRRTIPEFYAIRHAYRMRTTMLVHTKAIYRDLAQRDKTVKIPAGAEYSVPETMNPWKSSRPFSEAEIGAFLKEGIARHPLAQFAFQPVRFSAELVPASAALRFPMTYPVGELGPGRGTQTFYTYAEKSPVTLELRIAGGLIAHYRDRGHVRVELWKIGGASQTGEKETLVASDRSVPPDGVERAVKLAVKETGLFRLTVSDGGDRTQVRWPAGQPMTVVSSHDAPMNDGYGQWMQYFYVPKGTRDIGLFGGAALLVCDGDVRWA